MAAEESARRAEAARRAELERVEAEELAARRAEEAAKAAEENERRAQQERRVAEEAARIDAEAHRVKEAEELARVSFYVMSFFSCSLPVSSMGHGRSTLCQACHSLFTYSALCYSMPTVFANSGFR